MACNLSSRIRQLVSVITKALTIDQFQFIHDVVIAVLDIIDIKLSEYCRKIKFAQAAHFSGLPQG